MGAGMRGPHGTAASPKPPPLRAALPGSIPQVPPEVLPTLMAATGEGGQFLAHGRTVRAGCAARKLKPFQG